MGTWPGAPGLLWAEATGPPTGSPQVSGTLCRHRYTRSWGLGHASLQVQSCRHGVLRRRALRVRVTWAAPRCLVVLLLDQHLQNQR